MLGRLAAGEPLIADTPDFEKRAPRVGLRRPAILADAVGRTQRVTIINASSGGFGLELSGTVRIGEFVTIHVTRAVSFRVQIRWVLGNQAGAAFLAPEQEPPEVQ